MIASDQLHQLIKSMSKPEKRYFHLFASTHREWSSYLSLFNFINKQREYDERTIKKHFHSHSFVKQFAVTKHMLYKLILKSMNQYHTEHSADNRLREMLSAINFLFGRTLFSECKKMIARAKRIAHQLEKFELLLELIKWEKKLLGAQSTGKISEEEIITLSIEENMITKKINNIDSYWLLYRQASLAMVKYMHMRNKKEQHELKKITENSLMKNEKQALSFQAKVYFYQARSYTYRILGEGKKSYEARRSLFELWEDHPHFIREDAANYIHAMNQLLLIQLDKKNYADFIKTIEKLKDINDTSESVKLNKFLTYYPLKLNYHINTFAPADKDLAHEAEHEMEKIKSKLRKEYQLTMNYMIALYYFVQGEYKEAIRSLNKIINDDSINVREDIHCFARILNLISHYELKNFDLLEYIIRSTYRYILKMKHLYKFENLIIKFIYRLQRTDFKTDMIPLFKILKKDLSLLETDKNENKAFLYFDFISWVDSKIQKKTFAAMVKEKNLKNKTA